MPWRRRSARHSAPGDSAVRGAHAASVAAKTPAAAAAESAPAGARTEATAAAALAPAAAAEGAYAAKSGARARGRNATRAFAAAGVGPAGETPGAKLGARAPTAAAAPAEAACTPAAPCAALQHPAGPPAQLSGAVEAKADLAQPAEPVAQQAPTAADKQRPPHERRECTPAPKGVAGAKRATTGGSAVRRPKKQAYTAMGFPAITPTPGRSREPGARVPSPDENDAGAANARGGAAQNPSGVTPAAPASAPSRAPFGALPTAGGVGGLSSPAMGASAAFEMPSKAQSCDEGPRHGILCTSSGAPHAVLCPRIAEHPPCLDPGSLRNKSREACAALIDGMAPPAQ